MTYDVVITDPASDDVIEIVGYIKELTGSDDIADEYVMGILQTAKSLATMPFRFQISEELAMAGLDVRTASFKDYLLAYGIDEKAVTVYVYRILYSKSDIKERFFDKV